MISITEDYMQRSINAARREAQSAVNAATHGSVIAPKMDGATRIVLLNGPPRSGKNTAANEIAKAFHHAAIIGFSHHLKRMVHGVYLGRAGWDMDPDAFDAVKGEPQEMLSGMSWRQAYIHYSEQVIKPLHGKEWFGEQFVRAARQSGADLVIVPDSGFREEAERAIREFGASNVCLIRIHADGRGCSYAGDSRSYIDLPGVVTVDVANDGEPAAFCAEVAGVVRSWVR